MLQFETLYLLFKIRNTHGTNLTSNPYIVIITNITHPLTLPYSDLHVTVVFDVYLD